MHQLCLQLLTLMSQADRSHQSSLMWCGSVLGSPLGIFLTLRKVNPHKGNGLGSKAAAELMVGQSAKLGDGLPAVRRMYNLYHPYDPVGFR